MHPVTARGDYFTRVLVLLLSGILAHTLSGGAIIEVNRFLTLSVLIALALFLSRNISLEGPQLALMILIVQSTGHFLLGGADKSSDLQMSFAHILAGLLSYKAVTHFDRFWEFIAVLAQALRIPNFEILIFRIEISHLRWIVRESSITHFFSRSLQFRGPPTKEFV